MINPLTEEELVRRVRAAATPRNPVSTRVIRQLRAFKRREMTDEEVETYQFWNHPSRPISRWVIEAALACGLNPPAVQKRLSRRWDIDLALRCPVRSHARRPLLLDNGELVSIFEFERRRGMGIGTLYSRLYHNRTRMKVEEALAKPVRIKNGMFPCTGPNGVKTEMSRRSFCRLYKMDLKTLSGWMRNWGVTMDEARQVWEARKADLYTDDRILEIEARIEGRGRVE